jgi:hypothetical protein
MHHYGKGAAVKTIGVSGIIILLIVVTVMATERSIQAQLAPYNQITGAPSPTVAE